MIIGLYHAAGSGQAATQEVKDFCEMRAKTDYASGMGQIFRAVAELNPLTAAGHAARARRKARQAALLSQQVAM